MENQKAVRPLYRIEIELEAWEVYKRNHPLSLSDKLRIQKVEKELEEAKNLSKTK